MQREKLLKRTGISQRGAISALLALALVAMVGVAGLALDGAHSAVNLTRLQNTLDAAALSAAKTLDQTNGDTVVSEAEARAMFGSNASQAGNNELDAAYTSGQVNVTVEFSNTLIPFAPGTTPARYVRVNASNFQLPTWFASVLGINQIEVASSAVAGPSPRLARICNVAPIMVCGDPNAAANGDPFFGFTPGQPDVLKASNPQTQGTPGPGNFQLIRLANFQGGADIRRAMAGDFSACVNTTQALETEPGNTVGPTIQGINTRLGIYQGPLSNAQDQYPPDVVVTEVQPRLTLDVATDTILYQGQPANNGSYYSYNDYLSDVNGGNYDYNPLDGDPPGIGAFERRTMAVPVGDCSTATGGQSTLPMLGVLCYHLLQSVTVQGGGGNGNEAQIFGEFTPDGCNVKGNPGPDPDTGPGPYVIQLYKDPDATMS